MQTLPDPAQEHAPSRPQDGRDFVTALARGLEVLACFRSDTRLANHDIAKRCRLPKSTVSRLTATLTQLGYLVQSELDGKFRLGTAALALGGAMLSRLDVRKLALPLMTELATLGNMEVALGVRDRLSMVYVESCHRAGPVRWQLDNGTRLPVATSAIGRAWLTAIPPAERDEFLQRVRKRDAAAWPQTERGIARAMDEYRTLGVTCSFGEWQPHINGIACPVRPDRDLPPMAISCGGRATRLSPQVLLKEIRPRLVAMVARIEDALVPRQARLDWRLHS